MLDPPGGYRAAFEKPAPAAADRRCAHDHQGLPRDRLGARPGRGASLLHRHARLRRPHGRGAGRLPLDRPSARPISPISSSSSSVPGPPMMSPEAAEQVLALVAQGALGGCVFATDDCRRTHAELRERGVEFLQEPAERAYGVEATFRDDPATGSASPSGRAERAGSAPCASGARAWPDGADALVAVVQETRSAPRASPTRRPRLRLVGRGVPESAGLDASSPTVQVAEGSCGRTWSSATGMRPTAARAAAFSNGPPVPRRRNLTGPAVLSPIPLVRIPTRTRVRSPPRLG